MKIKNEKRLLTINRNEIDSYITYILQARNTFIKQGKPVELVNELLIKFMKLKKKLRA